MLIVFPNNTQMRINSNEKQINLGKSWRFSSQKTRNKKHDEPDFTVGLFSMAECRRQQTNMITQNFDKHSNKERQEFLSKVPI